MLLLAETPGYLRQGWLHAKLTLVALLIAFHGYCAWLTRRFGRGERPHGPGFLRVFNELPALVLIGSVLLVVLKPF
ncbi:MAG: CopD family protein [Xanthomonadales bacterium]|nr:CopD family protein [Xanthomonadales bacterium]